MDFIESTIPMVFETLSKFIGKAKEELPVLVADYENSSHKDIKFLTYCANIEVPVTFRTLALPKEDRFKLLEGYLSMSSVIDAPDLAIESAQTLLAARGAKSIQLSKDPFFTPEERAEFINSHIDLMARCEIFLSSLIVFCEYIVSEKEGISIDGKYPQIDDPRYVGLSIVNLFQIPTFLESYFSVPVDKNTLHFFTYMFKEYFYNEKNLYAFFAFDKNFLLLNFLYAIRNRSS